MPPTMRHMFGVFSYGEHTDGQDVATAPTMQRLFISGVVLTSLDINCRGKRVLTILV